MSTQYPNLTDEYIKPMINDMIANYYSNPSKNWMEKIAAINLIHASLIKTYATRGNV
jgi:hypothetical protein